MTQMIIHNMAPLMFIGLFIFLLLGYPVAFALAANGIVFGLIGIELGLLQPTLFQALSERMVKLIASGLIPLPGLTPEVTLQFHVAAVLLSEKIPDPTQVISELSGLLATMSSRTRRPIRFLEPETTTPTPLSSDSAFGPGRTGAFPIV